MLGPSPHATGGIATLITSYYRCGFMEHWPIVYFSVYEDGVFLRKLGRILVSFPRYMSILLTGHVGAVHVHTSFNISFWRKALFVLPAFLFSRCSVILHFHGGEVEKFYYQKSGPVRRCLIRYILDKSTYIVVLSKQLGGTVGNITKNKNIIEIGNFIDTQRFLEIKGERKKPIVLFLGKMVRAKGIYELLDAMAQVCKYVPDAQLVCGGDGEFESVTVRIRELGLEDRVKLVGWVSGDEVISLLSKSTLFVLPSHHEALPFALLEAMAAGLPVVVSGVGGMIDVVQNEIDGILIAPHNSGEIAKAIVRLLRDPKLCERMGARGRDKIVKRYSPAAALPKLVDLYQAIGISPKDPIT